MTLPLADWWRQLSDPARYRLYTRATLQAVIVVVIASLAFRGTDGWQLLVIGTAGAVGVTVIGWRPEFAADPRSARTRPWMIPAACLVLGALWLGCIAASFALPDDHTGSRVGVAAAFTVFVAAMAVLPFVVRPWSALLVLSAATGLILRSPVTWGLAATAAIFATGAALLGTALLTLWSLRIVDELERAKTAEAELKVAEERLRFGRDLHDVVGRGFSAIAVKSELATTLARAGAVDRAADEMDEVKSLAVESMEQMRALVRGYRDVDLEAEVKGARSLLSAAGCELHVEGTTAAIPSEFHPVAAWVVREGTTNIVKHSRARSATLALAASGMSLRNDGVVSGPGTPSGLRGLDERLSEVGARMSTTSDDGSYELRIRWGPS
ncbi:putative two-component histidine kinase [Gordonia araii NBRC 100433]|uniref:Putative two-component histidine kinase n=1 Tax=Gordonia araii NBRC 100433 TaxID=1073574 RepID=G7H4U8_9ACTN|nr:histidine kinase [Gordonia araii]NNG97987.1 histidine kinase [Gordonia araii NBRC 100433]GAB10873.1 putative two-component histidine kinase [Gordonia araii NBRC 100433]